MTAMETPVGRTPTRPGDDWYWGENRTADPVVLATVRGLRHLLLIRRGDCGKWALPGGWIEPGENPADAAARELAEETGLAIQVRPAPQRPRLVPDPRCTAWCWIVTTPVAFDLGEVGELPAVKGADDATEAAWLPARTFAELDAKTKGGLYEPHRGMLADLLA